MALIVAPWAVDLRAAERREHRRLLRPEDSQVGRLAAARRRFQWQVALGVINLVFTLIAIWMVDSWGRRPLLIWGMAVVALVAGGLRPSCC